MQRGQTYILGMDGWTVTWIAAVVASIIGFGSLFHMTYIANYWPKAIGRVVGNIGGISHHDSGSSDIYFAEIEFTASDGQTYKVKGDIGLQKPWDIGKAIPLHYKAKNPNHVLTWNFWQRMLFSFGFIAPVLLLWALIAGLVER